MSANVKPGNTTSEWFGLKIGMWISGLAILGSILAALLDAMPKDGLAYIIMTALVSISYKLSTYFKSRGLVKAAASNGVSVNPT